MSAQSNLKCSKDARLTDKGRREIAPALFVGIDRIRLERIDDVEQFLAVSRPLNIAERTAATIENSRLGDLFVAHLVGRADVLGAHHPVDAEFTNLEVDADAAIRAIQD